MSIRKLENGTLEFDTVEQFVAFERGISTPMAAVVNDKKSFAIAHSVCLLLGTLSKSERGEVFEAAFQMLSDYAAYDCHIGPELPLTEPTQAPKATRTSPKPPKVKTKPGALRGRPRDHASMMGQIETFVEEHPRATLTEVAEHFELNSTANERHRISRKLHGLLKEGRVTREIVDGTFVYSRVLL